MFDQYPDVVTIEELQEMLGIGRGLAYDLVNSGKIKGVKVGRGWRIGKKAVEQFMMQQKWIIMYFGFFFYYLYFYLPVLDYLKKWKYRWKKDAGFRKGVLWLIDRTPWIK